MVSTEELKNIQDLDNLKDIYQKFQNKNMIFKIGISLLYSIKESNKVIN